MAFSFCCCPYKFENYPTRSENAYIITVPLHVFVTPCKVYPYISNRSTFDYNRYIEKVNISYQQGHLLSNMFECYIEIFDCSFAHSSHVTGDAVCLSYIRTSGDVMSQRYTDLLLKCLILTEFKRGHNVSKFPRSVS